MLLSSLSILTSVSRYLPSGTNFVDEHDAHMRIAAALKKNRANTCVCMSRDDMCLIIFNML